MGVDDAPERRIGLAEELASLSVGERSALPRTGKRAHALSERSVSTISMIAVAAGCTCTKGTRARGWEATDSSQNRLPWLSRENIAASAGAKVIVAESELTDRRVEE
jgi:hypothetical protein